MHQTHDVINVYYVIIISYLYSFSNPIMCLSNHAHQTNPKIQVFTSWRVDDNRWKDYNEKSKWSDAYTRPHKQNFYDD